MKKRSTFVPLILLVYLAVMVYLGWPGYCSGQTSGWLYFGGTAFTIGVIVLLHFNLKKREEYRRRRIASRMRKENECNEPAKPEGE